MLRSALVLLVLLITTSAHAQSEHPRLALVRSLHTDSPAVLVDARSAWVATLPEDALALCVASRCAPIARSESCATPRCPGAGVLVQAAEELAHVDPFPTDYAGFTAELSALSAVPELASLMAHHGSHPNPPGPPLDLTLGHSDARVELGFEGGYVSSFDRPLHGGMVSATFGLRGQLDGDDFDAWFIGNQVSLDVALHTWLSPSSLANGVDVPMVLLGFRPALANTLRHSPLRVPTIVSLLIPEIGMAIRPDVARVDVYIAFGVEGSLILTPDLGIRLRASASMVLNTEESEETSDLEGLGVLSLGFFFPIPIDD